MSDPITTHPAYMTLAKVGRLIAALGAAFASSIVTILLFGQLAGVLVFWVAEVIASFAAATVWMVVGLKFSSRSSASAAALFLAGAATAWFLSRGVVHSTSPYYGLTSFAAAVIGGALVWTVAGTGARPRLISVAVPSIVLVIVGLGVLLRPHLGLARTLSHAEGDERQVHITAIDDSIYAWTRAPLRSDGTVYVELDPGSGPGAFQLNKVSAPATRSAVCERLYSATRSLVASEVESGSIPAFVTWIGYREADCRAGHIWRLLRRESSASGAETSLGPAYAEDLR